MADNKPTYSYEDKIQVVGTCSVCGQPIIKDNESPNGGVHIDCDKDYDKDNK